jgi:hypothetical protein
MVEKGSFMEITLTPTLSLRKGEGVISVGRGGSFRPAL